MIFFPKLGLESGPFLLFHRVQSRLSRLLEDLEHQRASTCFKPQVRPIREDQQVLFVLFRYQPLYSCLAESRSI